MTAQINDIIFYATSALLFAAVLGLEVYRLRAGKKGRIRRLTACADGFGLGEGRVEVEMEDGSVVEAAVPGCTQCVCRFRAGDAVVVTRQGRRYVVGPALV